MSDIHITRDMLRAVQAGALDPALLEGLRLQHLHTICPYCREEYQAWKAASTGDAAGLQVVEHLPAILAAQLPRIEKNRREAQRDLRALLKLPLLLRAAKLRRAHYRFRQPALAALLLEEAKKQIPAEPRLAYHFACLAYETLRRSRGSERHPAKSALTVQVLGFMGNARRAVGDLRRAGRWLQWARFTVRTEGVTDLLICAELDWYQGILCKDERLFEDARDFLLRSAMLYSLMGASADAARSLLTLSTAMNQAGETATAIQLARQALADLHPVSHPRLYAQARYNLALYLCEAAEYHQAADLLAADAELHSRFPDAWTQRRLDWLRGKIAGGLGDDEAAETSLLTAKNGFAETGNGYVTAMVSLDLAALYLEQGRTAEIQQLAVEMVILFEGRGVHREALAAALLFQRAAQQESLSRGLLRDLTSRLERACSDTKASRKPRRRQPKLLTE